MFDTANLPFSDPGMDPAMNLGGQLDSEAAGAQAQASPEEMAAAEKPQPAPQQPPEQRIDPVTGQEKAPAGPTWIQGAMDPNPMATQQAPLEGGMLRSPADIRQLATPVQPNATTLQTQRFDAGPPGPQTTLGQPPLTATTGQPVLPSWMPGANVQVSPAQFPAPQTAAVPSSEPAVPTGGRTSFAPEPPVPGTTRETLPAEARQGAQGGAQDPISQIISALFGGGGGGGMGGGLPGLAMQAIMQGLMGGRGRGGFPFLPWQQMLSRMPPHMRRRFMEEMRRRQLGLGRDRAMPGGMPGRGDREPTNADLREMHRREFGDEENRRVFGRQPEERAAPEAPQQLTPEGDLIIPGTPGAGETGAQPTDADFERQGQQALREFPQGQQGGREAESTGTALPPIGSGVAPTPQDAGRSRPAGTDTTPTAGFSPYLRNQRSRLARELQANPQTRLAVAGMLHLENAADPLGPAESLANRASMTGKSVRSHLFGGFYGPINRGQLPRAMRMLQQNPRLLAKYNRAIDTALSGSNVLGGATDQGSLRLGDPNSRNPSGRVMRSNEVYNDWGGVRNSAQWRRDQQRAVRAELKQSPRLQGQASSLPPPRRPDQMPDSWAY
jgi:hypothetical protein